jgi:hypothetical protein
MKINRIIYKLIKLLPMHDFQYLLVKTNSGKIFFASPEKVASILMSDGWFIALDLFDKKILNKLYDVSSEISNNYNQNGLSELPKELIDHEQLAMGHIFDSLLEAWSEKNLNSKLSYFDLDYYGSLLKFLNAAFQKNFSPSPITNMRRIDSLNHVKPGWDAPLSLHTDAMFHYPNAISVNFWTPLHALSSDSPRLRIYSAGPNKIKDITRFDGTTVHRSDGVAFQGLFDISPSNPNLTLDSHKLESQTPLVPFGSSLVFTNFAFHGTHIPLGSKKQRTSLELRYDAF